MSPGRGVYRPRTFQATGDRVGAIAGAVAVLPAESLCFDIAALRLDTDVLGRISGAMGFAEGMATGNQRSRLFIIHRHATESLTYGVERPPADPGCRPGPGDSRGSSPSA